MGSLSVDITFLPKGFDEFKYLLFTTHEITNFVLAVLIKSRTVQVTAEGLIHRSCVLLAQ